MPQYRRFFEANKKVERLSEEEGSKLTARQGVKKEWLECNVKDEQKIAEIIDARQDLNLEDPSTGQTLILRWDSDTNGDVYLFTFPP